MKQQQKEAKQQQKLANKRANSMNATTASDLQLNYYSGNPADGLNYDDTSRKEDTKTILNTTCMWLIVF